MARFPDLSDHLLALVYACLLPFLSGVRGREGLEGVRLSRGDRRRFYLLNSLFLATAAMPVILTWALHVRPFEAMGFHDRFLGIASGRSVWIPMAALFLLYVSDLAWNVRSARRNPAMAVELEAKMPFLPRSGADLPAYLVMCLAAAVSEEIIYRGFMVGYFLHGLNGREGSTLLAVVAPAALFSLAHLYQGWQAVTKIMVLSMLLAWIFIRSGSIWLVMALHFTVDCVSGLASMSLLGGRVVGKGEALPEEGDDEPRPG
jgi:membrane protease YdiL (CAAX protease family)